MRYFKCKDQIFPFLLNAICLKWISQEFITPPILSKAAILRYNWYISNQQLRTKLLKEQLPRARFKVQSEPLRCLLFVIQIRKWIVQWMPPLQDMVKNALQVLYKSFNKYIILLRGNSSQIGLRGIQTNALSSLGKLISWFCLNQLYHTKWYGQNSLWPGLLKTTQRKPDIVRHSPHNKQSFFEGASSTRLSVRRISLLIHLYERQLLGENTQKQKKRYQ